MTDFMPIDRRSLLDRALFLIGAIAAVGVSPDVLGQTAALPSPGATDFALLSAVADTIMPRTETPGAIDAQVPAKFDTLLVQWASPQRRTELIGALVAIDRMAKDKVGASFAMLPPARRKELLLPYDLAALTPAPRKDVSAGADAPVANPAYARLRELILLLYYYSEEALGGELTYEAVPGDWTPSIKVTPETHGTGGLGSFERRM